MIDGVAAGGELSDMRSLASDDGARDGIWDRMENWKSFRLEDLNDLFEDLAELKKYVRMRMHRRGLNAEKLKKIRKIIQTAKEEIMQVLKSE